MTDNSNQVTSRRIRDVVVVELPASFTSDIEKPFNEKVEWALADTPGGVVVDFSRVTVVDQGGIEGLKFLFKRTREIDLPVGLAGVSDSTKALLDQAGFLRHAELYNSVDEAAEQI
jgi:anti-anti-sigma regulatory factor